MNFHFFLAVLENAEFFYFFITSIILIDFIMIVFEFFDVINFKYFIDFLKYFLFHHH